MKCTYSKQFYFDLAGTQLPDHIHGLLRYVDASRLLYGSDYPWMLATMVKWLARRVRRRVRELEGLFKGMPRFCLLGEGTGRRSFEN